MKGVVIKSSLLIAAFLFGVILFNQNQPQQVNKEELRSALSPHAPIELKKGRAEYFFRMLRDPATNQIPSAIRQRELEFAKKLSEQAKYSTVPLLESNLIWQEAGPYDVGGRTRALGVDVTNPNVIIAGGASGGIWKSTDKGETWELNSTPSQIASISALVQDPRTGHTNEWYYATGEYLGSNTDLGQTAYYYGNGIYKSTDNGDSWNILPSTIAGSSASWDTPFDYVSNMDINPNTGSIFAASNGFGILRSTDGGQSFSIVLGKPAHHLFSDVVVATNGNIAAAVSIGFETPEVAPGIYISENDGVSWTSFTPNNYPQNPQRCVLAFAPSNPDILYALTFTGQADANKHDIMKFYKINISAKTAEDRSANLPDFGYNFHDFINTQQNYNLTLAVKPDDENFVMIGATSLFRSTDGFSTKPTNAKLSWIGGYHPQSFFYPDLHPDVHSFAFDPTDPNKMWWGHDGGLSYTTDIRTTSYNTFFPWINKNNGYNVTQFYSITIPDEAGDDRIMGGTQDNGTPFFRFDGTSATPFTDVSLGDGTYAYFGDNFAYTSSQFGNVNRVRYVNGVPDFNMNNINRIKPMGATKQLFVNPFVVDPSNEEIMYYPAGNILWRNDQLSSIPDDQNGTSIGWSELPNVSFSDGYSITALEVSKSNPMHQLYYGASGREKVPKIYKLPNANTATNNPIDVSVPNVPAGSYLHNIAVNPDDGNEVIMLFSNYNIEGLYHSTDGGESYTSIEGNLTGNEEDPGPSLRGVEIVPSDNGTMYFVGTSIGVFSTSNLNGLNTIWSQEGEEIIGNVIVNYISSRKSDGKVIAGTHGRGAFVTNVGGTGLPLIFADSEEMQIDCLPDSSANSFLTISNNGGGNLNYSITASGSFGDKFVSAVNSEKFEIADKSSSPVNISSVNADVAFAPNYNITGTDVLLLDDGDDSPDTFVGFEDMYGFAAVNEFLADGFDYTVEQIAFYARSENALTNSFYAAVCDGELNKLWESYENFDLSSNGKWFTIDISNPVKFDNGENFYLVVQSYFSFVLYPFGYDTLAQVTDHSYYVDPYDDTKLINVNTVPGLDKGAFLIRAIGTKGTAANEEPVAVATISNSNPIVGETVTFDASQSYDNDGQITAYLWDFGDGTTSNQKIATHAYSAANTYQFTLTVTDNTNATGYTQGQIVVTEEENQAPVAVASVSKNVAEINESISFDASQSYDDDGQIISYLWDFGDGNTSTEVNTTHSYSAADTYTFTLTVTDNEDASDQISGEIMITDSNYVQRLIVTPSSGTLSGGESETIRIDFFSEGLAEGNYVGEVNITSNGGNKTIPLNIRVDKTVNVEEIVQNSYDYKLEQNYPNPFNPITRIEFQIPQRENVEIKIYDITGREVTTLINEVKNPGTYSVSFDGSKYASGVYFYRIKTGEYISSRKLVLLK